MRAPAGHPAFQAVFNQLEQRYTMQALLSIFTVIQSIYKSRLSCHCFPLWFLLGSSAQGFSSVPPHCPEEGIWLVCLQDVQAWTTAVPSRLVWTFHHHTHKFDFIFGGSKITADGDCSHEIKRRLLLGRTFMTNLDIIFKSRDITLPTKVCLVKAMVFPVVMYGCESWTVKKAERQRIYAFELWCWRRLLRVRWTARRSNQSILKEISPGISLEEWC